ncbi:MAG TPA: nitronate monooxygenase, partial [Capillimicrobium sp.]|nr:nitronate monooxygenase [Capillimicrobium sp.]
MSPTGRPLDFAVLSPAGRPDARLPIAASRAGAIGVLDLQFARERSVVLQALRDLAERGRGRFGVHVPADEELLRLALDASPRPPDVVILGGRPGRDVAAPIALARGRGARTLAIATSLDEALAAEAAGADAIVGKGHEAAGWIGEESTFVLLQRLRDAVSVPVWAQGGVGRHTAAACLVAGAEGAILDAQVLLARESPLDDAVRARVAAFDGSETVALGADLGAAFRLHVRPDLPAATALAEAERQLVRDGGDEASARDRWQAAVEQAVDWDDLDRHVLAVGQDASFAAGLARHRTVAGILDALGEAALAQCAAARRIRPLAEGAPLAASHGTRYPVLQGPMTRVSDRSGFAAAVVEGGGLPFLALALMRHAEVDALLEETAARMGDRPWGVGILGFVPAELREEQLASIREHRPPFALIAGGRPAQARALEEHGIETYLHVPSPGLLRLYLREGARRFVFEGRECGGHVGPRTSFVLWDTMVRTLLDEASPSDLAACHVVLAGGLHDALSAAMAAAIAAPLAERGARVGVLAGTAYLFTEEAVASGAITPGFQAAAIDCRETVFLESGPGHATRCLPSPFAAEFAAEKRRLVQEGRSSQEVREALEVLNIGRLRVASKGKDRNPAPEPGGAKLVDVDAEEQWRRGMYMIGQVAALRDRVERHVGDEAAPARVRLVARRAVGVEVRPPVEAVRRHLTDRVDPV